MREICYRCMQRTVQNGVCLYCHTPAVRRHPEKDANLLPLGTRLDNGNIIVGDKLGAGGFGITYIAYDSTYRLIALKEFFPSAYVTRQGRNVVPHSHVQQEFNKAKRDFDREVRQLKHLIGHPNIVQVLFQIEENNTIYYGMELLQGETLKQYIARNGAMSTHKAYEMLEPIMNALIYAHQRHCIHRDVAPDNIVLRKGRGPGQAFSPCLIDFGAAYTDEKGFTRTIPKVCKPGFSPIEQAAAGSVQGEFTDVHALAATFYYMITKMVPPTAQDRAFHDKEITPARTLCSSSTKKIDDILAEAMEQNSEKRIQTVMEFRDRLRKELVSKPLSIPVPDPDPNYIPRSRGGSNWRSIVSCLIEWTFFYGVAVGAASLRVMDTFLIGSLLNVVLNMASIQLLNGATIGQRIFGIGLSDEDSPPPFGKTILYCLLRALIPVQLVAEIIALSTGNPPFTETMCGLDSSANILHRSAHISAQGQDVFLRCTNGSMVGQSIQLKARQTFGREGDIQILKDGQVSRIHCTLLRRGGRCYLRDDQSKNGTFLNHQKINRGIEYPLSNGDVIGMGSQEFVINQK